MNKPLVIQGLSKSFDDKKVIDNISLDVDACETFILLGPNGAGKTTTIKLITGLLAP
ncbi:MAG TPA: ATP-binding cassette domain-containing protein, partial [bacterium (Candidatus Stahlbacteria)]|nr:ATP-binding cassette domain-containing protein [Candidatus Stahlbacteria bacterium]